MHVSPLYCRSIDSEDCFEITCANCRHGGWSRPLVAGHLARNIKKPSGLYRYWHHHIVYQTLANHFEVESILINSFVQVFKGFYNRSCDLWSLDLKSHRKFVAFANGLCLCEFVRYVFAFPLSAAQRLWHRHFFVGFCSFALRG